MESKELSIVLIGIGGYGSTYVRELLKIRSQYGLILAGAVDPHAESSDSYPDLVSARIPICRSIEEFYSNSRADLGIISSPIHWHVDQMIGCMEHGSHVLCEKPLCALYGDIARLLDVRERTGKKVAIGYQWSHSQAILHLKADVLAGRFGKCLRMKTIVLTPRNLAYYARSTRWAGKRKSEDDRWILDSVASNAASHFLHNMLFIAGSAIDRSADVRRIEAEAYRANAIQTYDTCALRMQTTEDVEMLFLASHAIPMDRSMNLNFEMDFELGRVSSEADENGKIRILARMSNGESLDYGCPDDDPIGKLYWMIDAVRGARSIVCGIEAAAAHVRCTNAVFELFHEPPKFPSEFLRFDEGRQQVYCEGLDTGFVSCFEKNKLPFEAGAGWAMPARCMQLSPDDRFEDPSTVG